MEKLENFKRKQFLFGIAAVVLGVVILHLPEKHLLLTEAVCMIIGCCLMTVMLHACWDVGVAIQDGRMSHGPCRIRMNLALPLSRVQEAFERMDKYVFNA